MKTRSDYGEQIRALTGRIAALRSRRPKGKKRQEVRVSRLIELGREMGKAKAGYSAFG